MTPSEASLANLTPDAAVKHGLYTEAGKAAVEAATGPYIDALTKSAPWVAVQWSASELRAWAFAEAEAEAWRQHLMTTGMTDAAGEPRGALDALHRAEGRAAKFRANLGLNPRAFAQLHKAMAEAGADDDSLDAIKAEGRRIIEGSGGPG